VSRLQVLADQPRKALGALFTVALATAAVVGSGANFTASTANPANVFTAGTLTMDNSKKDAAILTASGLRPGGPAQSGVVDIQNTGSLSGTFTLGRGTPVDSDTDNPMSAKLNVVVTDCGVGAAPTCGDTDDAELYSGTLAAMPATKALGSYAGGAKHRYQFSVALDSSADDAYQGDDSRVGFTWSAAS
jgi:hypothetical protein